MSRNSKSGEPLYRRGDLPAELAEIAQKHDAAKLRKWVEHVQDGTEVLPSDLLAALKDVLEEMTFRHESGGRPLRSFDWLYVTMLEALIMAAERRQIDSTPLLRVIRALEEHQQAAEADVKQAQDTLNRLHYKLRSVQQEFPLILDAEHKVVELEGKTFPLTPRQTEVLQALVKARGGYVRGEELKYDSKSSERVDELMKGLPDAIRRHIEGKSGHGGGYRLKIRADIRT